MNSAFNDQILAEKLKKLNNSQQSIETLSHWCIFHRKKAHLVVETWDKQLRVLPKEQRIPFLYLANDILQNSRRRGGEFVIEFWKVLPGALKDVLEKGDDQAQNVVLRLVDIWDDRKVFGIRGKTLREELLGAEPPTDLSEQHLKSNNNTKMKVVVSSLQEKLFSAYRSVQSAAYEEEAMLGRCHAAALRIDGLEKEADRFTDKGILVTALQEQEELVSHCIGQLETNESAKVALISLLKEALKEQENKLEIIRIQLQNVKAKVHHSEILRQQFLARNSSPSAESVQNHAPIDENLDVKMGSVKNMAATETYQWPPLPPSEEITSFVDGFKGSIIATSAAEVAAKLAASSSSAQVLASVLSSMVAEEASNVRTVSAPLEAPSNTSFTEKRQKIDEESDFLRSSENNSAYVHQPPPLPPPPPLQGTVPQFYSGSVQLYSSSSQQGQLHYPPLPPGPMQPPNMSTQAFQYASVVPRAPPLPPHPPIQGQAPLNTIQTASTPQVFNSGTYPHLRLPGIGFFDQQSLQTGHLPRH